MQNYLTIGACLFSRVLQCSGTICLPAGRETTALDMQLVQCWWATSGVSLIVLVGYKAVYLSKHCIKE